MWLLGLDGSRDVLSMTDQPPKRRGVVNQAIYVARNSN
jgi:hypothetical protein